MDIIQHAIEGIGKLLAKAFFGKEDRYEIILEQPGSAQNFAAILNAMVSEGDYNGAENLLFEEIEKGYDYELYYIGLDFFDRLSKLSDEELKKGNYSKEEIEQGLNDLKQLIMEIWNLQE